MVEQRSHRREMADINGTLDVVDDPGVGTGIRICSPVAAGSAAVPFDTADDDVLHRAGLGAGSGTVLLIDDDAMVRLITGEMLRELDFDVTEASSAAEGIALIEGGLCPDLVMTDHIMPGMTGAELAAHLHGAYPDIAILIMSGYQGMDFAAPDVVRLSKPFRQAQLTASIAAARERQQRRRS